MKLFSYILIFLVVGNLFAACDTDIENETIVDPYT